jgi:hypothetical protein
MKLKTGNDCVTAAANIRAELRATFPGVKWSVRTSKYSMGNDVTIYWTDGPTREEVSQLTAKYLCGSFDSYTDCYEYSTSDFNEKHGGTKYLHFYREYSDAAITGAVQEIAAKYGAHNGVATPADYRNGNACRTSPIDGHDGAVLHRTWAGLIEANLEKKYW